MSKGLDYVIGGWQIATLGDWRGGLWSSVASGVYMSGDPTLSADQRVEMNINGRHQRLWFSGYFDPTTATNVTGGNLEALVPADPAARIVRPLGPTFNNRVPVQLADGSIFNASISDLLNPNAKGFYRGPGLWNTDVALYKNFNITERLTARFSTDFFNVFNHPNDLNPNTDDRPSRLEPTKKRSAHHSVLASPSVVRAPEVENSQGLQLG